MATETKRLTKEDGAKLMRLIDSYTSTALWKEGLEAFRFDCDVHHVEGFMVLKIKVRPMGGSIAQAPARVTDPLWSVRCFNCDNNAFHTTPDRTVAIAWRDVHRNNCPGHDARLISIPRD